jgi:hypothetical protein
VHISGKTFPHGIKMALQMVQWRTLKAKRSKALRVEGAANTVKIGGNRIFCARGWKSALRNPKLNRAA